MYDIVQYITFMTYITGANPDLGKGDTGQGAWPTNMNENEMV